MREVSEIRFRTGGRAANRRLVEAYVLDAVDRLPDRDFCEYVAFVPMTHDAVGGGNLWLTVAGDADALVAHESGRWDELVEEGLASGWDVTEVTEQWYDNAGRRGGEVLFRLHRVANRATKTAVEEFEERPAPLDTYEEASNHPVGWWMVPQIVTAHQGYTLEETVDVLLRGIQHTYEDIDEFDSSDAAVSHLDDCIRSLEALRDDLDA